MPKRISPATHAAIDILLVGALLLGGSLLWHCYRRLRGPRTRRWRLRGWEPLGIGA
ncbi:MAG TPA: hypothetical protein PKK95_01265 [Vicinamibacterales bacterium]|nr:hypothetical protein [Acidobacteriota bacterium]HOC16861.1 hypothetical protein [Vicinamibacterales bacterium]